MQGKELLLLTLQWCSIYIECFINAIKSNPMMKFTALSQRLGPRFHDRQILVEVEHVNGEKSRKLLPTKLNPMLYSLELITQLMNLGHELVKELLEYFIPADEEVPNGNYEPEEVVEWSEDFPNGDPHFSINGVSYSYWRITGSFGSLFFFCLYLLIRILLELR